MSADKPVSDVKAARASLDEPGENIPYEQVRREMGMDKPVSLAERWAACCPCSGILEGNYGLCEVGCRCSSAPPHYQYPDGIACLWPGHALEAEAKALERQYNFLVNDHPDDEHPPRYWYATQDADKNDCENCAMCERESAEARVKALVEVLNRLRANVAVYWGAYEMDLRTVMGNANYAVVEEMLKRTAALADEPRKEPHEAD